MCAGSKRGSLRPSIPTPTPHPQFLDKNHEPLIGYLVAEQLENDIWAPGLLPMSPPCPARPRSLLASQPEGSHRGLDQGEPNPLDAFWARLLCMEKR